MILINNAFFNKQKEPFVIPNYLSLKAIKTHVLESQTKIAIALRNKEIKKAMLLSRSLVRSKAARALAVHKVISNKGYRSSGLSEVRPSKVTDYLDFMREL